MGSTTSENKQTRSCYLDALNVLACFSVVLLHTTDYVFTNAGGLFWYACAFVQAVFIFAVPIFIMISGANLLNYRTRYSTSDFFRKRAVRILGVFLGFSVLFYLVRCFIPEPFGYDQLDFSPIDFLQRFISNDINAVFWYFYTIIGLYALTPLLSLIADNKRLLEYLIAICLITDTVFPHVGNIFGNPDLFASFTYPYFGSYLLYFVLGYYLAHHFRTPMSTVALLGMFAAAVCTAFALSAFTNYSLRLDGGEYSSFYVGSFSPLEFLAISSLFLAAKSLEPKLRFSKLHISLVHLSSLSLGIYALHMFPMRFIDSTFLLFHRSILVKAIIVYAISAVVVWAWHKVTAYLKPRKTATKKLID